PGVDVLLHTSRCRGRGRANARWRRAVPAGQQGFRRRLGLVCYTSAMPATQPTVGTGESFASRIRNGFSPLFWVGNTLEIFERLAFYGSKAVLSFYLANKIGLGVTAAASLAGLFSGLIYALPIVAGVFVD